MRVSKTPTNSILFREFANLVYQSVADFKKREEAEEFLKTFLSEAEHTTLIKRIGVAYYLREGKSYNNIKNSLKVSSATISLIQRSLKQPYVQTLLQKIKTEEWANGWTKKIKGLIKV